MTKILKSLAMIVGVVVIAGGGTYAAWDSIKTSTSNTFAAGTLELKLSKDANMSSSATALFTEQALAPGVMTAEKTLYLKNVGSIAGKVKINVSYVDYDTSHVGAVSANAFASKLQLVSAVTDGQDVVPFWTSQIIGTRDINTVVNNGEIYLVSGTEYKPTMFGLASRTFYFEHDSSGTGNNPVKWNAGDAHKTTFQFRLSPDAGNEYQGNGINATLTATMVQYDGGTF